jgi:hypothetical protein
MAIQYDHGYTVELGPPPGGAAVSEAETLGMIQWIGDQLEVANGVLRLNWFSLNEATFNTLRATCPTYAPLQQKLRGLKWALMAAARRLVLGDNVTAVNTQINMRLTDAATAQGLLAFAYHLGNVRPEPATTYVDLRNVINLLLQHVRFMECRVQEYKPTHRL